jgi:hypothetical protein
LFDLGENIPKPDRGTISNASDFQTFQNCLPPLSKDSPVLHFCVYADMFKKFNASEDVAGRQNIKSSVQRGMKSKIVETFPKLEPYMEEIIPKKSQLTLVKWHSPKHKFPLTYSREHISLLTLENEVLFFQRFDDVYTPSLRLVHKCLRRSGHED